VLLVLRREGNEPVKNWRTVSKIALITVNELINFCASGAR
jgi:hypothetical protein